jgi:hypothetical protein
MQHHADRYHEELDRLTAAGYDVEEFRLKPERDMFYESTGSSPRTGTTYAKTRSVYPGVLEAKMDALMSYFTLDAEQAPIGFKAPKRR